MEHIEFMTTLQNSIQIVIMIFIISARVLGVVCTWLSRGA